ncbi:hypothetical protein WG66_008504 [Moniliophthora roreri]|nr:hypothetical protein WG66_008504 [Moniliophthora roreri]
MSNTFHSLNESSDSEPPFVVHKSGNTQCSAKSRCFGVEKKEPRSSGSSVQSSISWSRKIAIACTRSEPVRTSGSTQVRLLGPVLILSFCEEQHREALGDTFNPFTFVPRSL